MTITLLMHLVIVVYLIGVQIFIYHTGIYNLTHFPPPLSAFLSTINPVLMVGAIISFVFRLF